MNKNTAALRELILGMRAAYARKENAMEYARNATGSHLNSSEATLIAYDLQTGAYTARVQRDPAGNERWCEQLASRLAPYITGGCSLLEVGCGEATTLAGVLRHLPSPPQKVLGFDLSWSRCSEGREWLASQKTTADLFVGDFFTIPLADASVDVVYTSHSIEPNGGREEAAMRELLRVTRRALVLFEPIYELASVPARRHMDRHGYVRELQATAERLGAVVSTCEVLPYSPNPLNPSGIVIIRKNTDEDCVVPQYCCPLTATPLIDLGDVYCSESTGIVYPVIRGIPMLRIEHAVIASKLAPGSGRHSTSA